MMVLLRFRDFHEILSKCKPIYETFTGWKSSTFGMKKFSDLPTEAKNYLSFIEKTLSSKISLISTGPKREEVIEIDNPIKDS